MWEVKNLTQINFGTIYRVSAGKFSVKNYLLKSYFLTLGGKYSKQEAQGFKIFLQ